MCDSGTQHARQHCQTHFNEKNNDARYTANNTLPAHHEHKACTKHKRKHFHEIIQVSWFKHNGTWFHSYCTNFRANRCSLLYATRSNTKSEDKPYVQTLRAKFGRPAGVLIFLLRKTVRMTHINFHVLKRTIGKSFPLHFPYVYFCFYLEKPT